MQNVMEELNRCGYHGANCHNADDERWCDKFKKPTIFDKITASPEVLAEKLVYRNAFLDAWVSNVIQSEMFRIKSEAIAATVAKLKEVCDE